MYKSIFYCLTKLAYKTAIPTALMSAILTCGFQLRLVIGDEERNVDDSQDEEQNEQLESVLIFDIRIPSFTY